MKTWFRMEVASDASTVDIYIYDFIGGWREDFYRANGFLEGMTTAKSFLEELNKISDAVKTIRLHVNSPGGDVFTAVTIANLLREQRQTKGRTVEALIEGLAASAASVLIMGADTITMGAGALLMVHNPWSWVIGEAKEMRQAADELDKFRDQAVVLYQLHSTLGKDELMALLDATTWLDADEAVEKGLATGKREGLKAAASLDPQMVKQAKLQVPEKYRARVDALLEKPAPAPQPMAAAEVIRACKAAGCLELAEELVAANATAAQVTTAIESAKASKAAAEARATEIRALCQTAKLPQLADGYIQGGMPVALVRTQLAVVTAATDRTDINGQLRPDAGAAPKASQLSATAIYAARNQSPTQTKE